MVEYSEIKGPSYILSRRSFSVLRIKARLQRPSMREKKLNSYRPQGACSVFSFPILAVGPIVNMKWVQTSSFGMFCTSQDQRSGYLQYHRGGSVHTSAEFGGHITAVIKHIACADVGVVIWYVMPKSGLIRRLEGVLHTQTGRR